MADPAEAAVQAFEDFRARMRAAYAGDRAALADCFRTVLAGRVPKKATHLFVSVGYDAVILHWDPPGRSPSVNHPFQTPPPVDEAAAFGVGPERLTALLIVPVSDVVVEAWAEAGGFGQPWPLAMWRTVVNAPGDPVAAVEQAREYVRQAAATLLGGGSTADVRAPLAASVPPPSAERLAGLQSGDPGAAAAWAADLEAAGHAATAGRVRWLADFAARIEETVKVWAGMGAFYAFAAKNTTWWGCGEDPGATPGENTPDAVALGDVLAAWGDFHPALEWFFRRVGLPKVKVTCARWGDGRPAPSPTYDLAAGDHFGPFEPGAAVTGVAADVG